MALRCPSELGSAPTIEGARSLLSRAPDSAAPRPQGVEPGSGTRRFRKGTTWRLSVVPAVVTGAGHTAPGRSTAARPRPVRTAARAPTGRTGLTPVASCVSSGGEPTRASSGRPNSPLRFEVLLPRVAAEPVDQPGVWDWPWAGRPDAGDRLPPQEFHQLAIRQLGTRSTPFNRNVLDRHAFERLPKRRRRRRAALYWLWPCLRPAHVFAGGPGAEGVGLILAGGAVAASSEERCPFVARLRDLLLWGERHDPRPFVPSRLDLLP
jgi:hypothetical protein